MHAERLIHLKRERYLRLLNYNIQPSENIFLKKKRGQDPTAFMKIATTDTQSQPPGPMPT